MSPALPLSLALAFGLCIGSGPSRNVAPPNDPAGGDTSHYVLKDSLHRFRFSILEHAADDTCRALAVDIGPLGPDAPAQHVELDDLPVPCPLADGRLPAIEVIDLDFDGIRDLRLLRTDRDQRIPSYRYWLFDQADGSFKPCPALDSIQHPNFDRERHLVGSQWYRRPGLRGSSTFRFAGGRLVMMANMEKYTEGDHERWVIWGMRNGVLRPVEERTMPLPPKP